MPKTRLYIVRHGKTMFNTIGRAQGWSDTPLTDEGERGIRELGLGLKDAGIDFKQAYYFPFYAALQQLAALFFQIYDSLYV